ncbi:MAG: SPFH domain-containing protein [Acidobacteria bacterium]|nr:SPFH domain-containing protein [Acidobacteriota bacterium]
MIREATRPTLSGLIVIPILLALLAGGVLGVAAGIRDARPAMIVFWLVTTAAGVVLGALGFVVVAPNEGKVMQLFGAYAGTVRQPGLRWTNPFLTARRVSMRVRNFESSKLKVNDLDGNPIEIAAVVVWKVVDTAEALFQVDNYENFMHVQTEAALRNLATSYSYDSHEDSHMSLRANAKEIAEHLKKEVQERLDQAGISVIETRISHLAYAAEIAQAMLRRQQASAIIAARQKIVEGAVGMVEMALAKLSEQKIVVLDEERKASMVSNLLVVLCSDHATQPVVNTGTLYQ